LRCLTTGAKNLEEFVSTLKYSNFLRAFVAMTLLLFAILLIYISLEHTTGTLCQHCCSKMD